MGAALATVAPLQLERVGPKVCRNGHPLSLKNTRRTAQGVAICLTCQTDRNNRHHPRVVAVQRLCVGCGNGYEQKRGPAPKRPLCPECKGTGSVKVLPLKPATVGTRTCTTCKTKRPIDEFEASATDAQAVGRYVKECEDCRTIESPFAIAKRQVEKIFGVPSRLWMNRGRHPLNVLHHARMISIHNSRPNVQAIPVSPRWNTMTAWRLIIQAGLTKRLKEKIS